MFWCFCPCDSCIFMCPRFKSQGLRRSTCFSKGLMLFMLSQSGAWPTNKGHPVVGKTAKGWKKTQSHSIINTVRILPQNNNNKALACIPHTMLPDPSDLSGGCLPTGSCLSTRISNSTGKLSAIQLIIWFFFFFSQPDSIDSVKLVQSVRTYLS